MYILLQAGASGIEATKAKDFAKRGNRDAYITNYSTLNLYFHDENY
jgi:hypothetical protein